MSTSAKIAMVLVVVLVAVGVVAVKKVGNAPREEQTSPPVPPSSSGSQPTAAAGSGPSTQPAVQGTPLAAPKPLPRLVDLGADRCIPCKMMAPILEDLRQQYAGRLSVEFHDVWKYPAIATRHGIRVIPTQIFFDAAGRELWRHEGFISKEDILAKWKALGVDLSGGAGN